MTPEVLHSRLAAYLAMRETLGFRMRAPTLLLTDFVWYVIAHDLPDPIRAQLAVDWACSGSATRGVGGHAARLSVVRGFLSFLRASAPETEVPDRHLLATARRPLPYLFSAEELTRLLTALEPPRPCRSLRPVLWQTFIGLLASTGLRVGEARRLTVDDVGLDGTPPHLRIVETKFRKSQIVPGRCFRAVDPLSEESPKLIAIDEEASHEIVHRRRFGKANDARYEMLDPGP